MGMIADLINRLRRDKPEVALPGHPSKVRERGVFFAREMPLSPDIEQSIKIIGIEPNCLIVIVDPVAMRIGVDNMVAMGFEMGYAAATDDREPARSLGGASESRRGKR